MNDLTAISSSLNRILISHGQEPRDFSACASLDDLAMVIMDGTLPPVVEADLLAELRASE